MRKYTTIVAPTRRCHFSIAQPIGLYDCCGVSDGAACAIVTRPEIAESLGKKNPVSIKALQLSVSNGTEAGHNSWDGSHPVLDMSEAARHPHNRGRQTFVEVDGVVQPNAAPRFSRTPAKIKGPPVAPGTHTESALVDWGFSEAEIKSLAAAGVIGTFRECRSSAPQP